MLMVLGSPADHGEELLERGRRPSGDPGSDRAGSTAPVAVSRCRENRGLLADAGFHKLWSRPPLT